MHVYFGLMVRFCNMIFPAVWGASRIESVMGLTSIHVHIYIYIYICVCVRITSAHTVEVKLKNEKSHLSFSPPQRAYASDG